MSKLSLTDQVCYQLLKKLEEDPNVSQRELARELGVSVGKANYCIKAVIDVGYVKLGNFAKSNNKLRYTYILTSKGLKEKVQVTLRFLNLKQQQYDLLQREIAELQNEVKDFNS